ncbi:hypothetical protein M3J09_006941 [Ascochyta lentis]
MQVPPTPTNDFDIKDHRQYKKNMMMMDFEHAQLSTFFLEEMQRISLDWMSVFRREGIRHDIFLAIEKSGNDRTVK